jgi:cytochrome b561
VADAVRRPLRNGAHGYGVVTRTLHWAMALAILTQFVLGFTLDPSGRGLSRRGGYHPFGSDRLLTVHVILGSAILTLAVVRLTWRLTTPLPPWAATLTASERAFAHWTECALYALMFVMPLTGLLLVVADKDEFRTPHLLSHIAFFIVLVLHVSLVLKHQILDQDRLLRRML